MDCLPEINKVTQIEELTKIVSNLKGRGQRIVFTNGCFDILHAGHVSCLQRARDLGDVLIVGLNSDSSTRSIKGPERPIVQQEDRAFILASMECVDYVVIFDSLFPQNIIEIIRPDIHVKGGDYSELDLPESKLVRSYGGDVVILEELEGRRTTDLISSIRQSSRKSKAGSANFPVVVGIIPARFGSTRFPGKVLAEIMGKPIIQHVWERTRTAVLVQDVLIATDDERVRVKCESFGAKVVMTSSKHLSGTDRIAEAVQSIKCDVVVNVQGDEPIIDPTDIDSAVKPLTCDMNLQMSTLARQISNENEYNDPNVVKVVVNVNGYAVSFSRTRLPYFRAPASFNNPPAGASPLHHIGLYVYRRDFLTLFSRWDPTPLEQAEQLEQMRAIEHGIDIKVVQTDNNVVGVDTREDFIKVSQLLGKTSELGQIK